MTKVERLRLDDMQEHMIDWAMAHLGDRRYAGWCLSFVEGAIEQSNDIETFGGDSAKASYLLYQDAVQTGVPLRGSVVFYDCLCRAAEGLMDWGHCGIALEDGQVIHAWDQVRIDLYLTIETFSTADGHPKYLGWVPLTRILEQKP